MTIRNQPYTPKPRTKPKIPKTNLITPGASPFPQWSETRRRRKKHQSSTKPVEKSELARQFWQGPHIKNPKFKCESPPPPTRLFVGIDGGNAMRIMETPLEYREVKREGLLQLESNIGTTSRSNEERESSATN